MELIKATAVVRDELLKKGEFYKAFVSSVKSAIDEAPNYLPMQKLAESIADRIIGDETIDK